MMIKNYQQGLPATKRLGWRERKKLAILLTQTNPSAVEPALCLPRLTRAGLG